MYSNTFLERTDNMKLRSKLKPTSVESNLISLNVGKYTYKVDLLTLIVYDEFNTKYTLESILEDALKSKEDLFNLQCEFKQKTESQEKTNKKLADAFDACIKYTKTLQNQIITLNSELSKLKEGK